MELIDVYLGLANNYYPNELEQAKRYGEQALAVSRDLDQKARIGESLFVMGRIENEKRTDMAMTYYFEALEIFNELGNKRELGKTFNNLGIIHKNQGKYRLAFDYYSKSYERFEDIGDIKGMSQVLGNIGVLFRRQAEYEKAIDYFLKSLRLKEKLDDKIGIAITYGNLGNLHKDQGNLDEALEFNLKSLETFRALNQKKRIALALNNVGIIYEDLGDYQNALKHYKESLAINIGLDDKTGIALSLNNIGSILNHQGNYQASLANYQKALEIFRELDEAQYVAEGLIDIGLLHIQLNDLVLCEPMLREGLELARRIGNRKIELDGLYALSLYYEAKQDFMAALSIFKRYEEIKDSVFNLQKTEQLRDIQTRYETEKKDQENALLNSVIQRQNIEKAALLLGAVLLLIFAVYFYRTTQLRKRTNELLAKKQEEIIQVNQSLQKSQEELHRANRELQKLNLGLEGTVKERTQELQISNKELDTFLYQSSHALRRPIVSVLGLVQLARMEPSPRNVADVYQKIERTASGMDKMLKKLAMASEINHGQHKVDPIHLEQILPELEANLKGIQNGTEFEVDWSIQPGMDFNGDKELMEMVLEYLMENAIYFHGESNGVKPRMKISADKSPDSKEVIIKVYDNGMGIAKDVQSRIFDMFIVGTDIPTGNGYGLGLYLVRKALAKMGGEISFRSTENEYTEFTISLPLNLEPTSTA